jgi:hypothetical protein
LIPAPPNFTLLNQKCLFDILQIGEIRVVWMDGMLPDEEKITEEVAGCNWGRGS